MKKTATIKDVAKELGISVSTVSRVMNGLDRVSPAMRKKVLDTARRLNYVPSLAAVSVVRRQTKLLAALLPDLTTPLYASILEAFEEAARIRGITRSPCSLMAATKRRCAFLIAWWGALWTAWHYPSSPVFSNYSASSKPIVFIDRLGNETGSTGCGGQFPRAYLATEHLISRGHNKIAIIASEREFSSGHDRVLGFEQALRNKNIRIRPQYICVGAGTEKDGYAGAFRLMHLDDPPTAIFAASEPLCRATIAAIHDLKLRIGKDISLVGFGDSDFARTYSPAITVVSRAAGDMGKIGANMLIEKLTSLSPRWASKWACPFGSSSGNPCWPSADFVLKE